MDREWRWTGGSWGDHLACELETDEGVSFVKLSYVGTYLTFEIV